MPEPAATPPSGGPEAQDGEAAKTRREAVRIRQLARLGALFAGFAHEIKNPLSTIGLNLQLVKEDLGEPDSPRDQRIVRRLNVVESEVRRLQGILEQFLGYVRVPELHTRRMHLDSLLRELVEFVQPEMRERGVPVRFLGDGADREVELDADQFRAVIVNLLRNAMDACQDGGEVIVTTRTQGGVAGAHEAIVQVIDTGSGMTPEVREKAFTPYFSTKKQGTGLGLPTARRIVEQHGGSIQLDSEPGRGTAFTIRLPLAGASALPPRTGASADAADEENDG
ncbi:MAG: GHKL domain-containing protein [Planctomycetes bacterium]|nr:GHKL domain-containing protein [Planctomycetota bacterium]